MTKTNVTMGGVFAFVVLYVLMLYFDWHVIEQDLVQRTTTELASAGYAWVSVKAHQRGRDLLLGGSAPNQQARTEAIQLAQQVWGVRTVDAEVAVSPPTVRANLHETLGSAFTIEDRLTIQLPADNPTAVTKRVVDATSAARQPIHEPTRLELDPVDFCQQQFYKLLATEAIRFESNSARLQPLSYWLLDSVVKTLAECPNNGLRIVGHTDSSGSAGRNENLSLQRAISVRDYLISAGIAAKRLQALGKGATESVAENTTPEGRALNRRIELQVLK